MKETVKQRIKRFVSQKGISMRSFEIACGLSNGYFNGLKSTPSEEKSSMILDAFPELNRIWLLTGEGDMLNSTPSVVQTNQNGDNINGVNVSINRGSSLNSDKEATSIDVVPVIPAEIYKESSVDVVEYVQRNHDTLVKKPKVPLFPQYDAIYEVYDESMSDKFKSGDMLALKPMQGKWMIINGEPYVINTYSSGLIFRLLYDDGGDTITCKSFKNERFTDFKVSKVDIANIFRIVGLIRINV